MTRSHKGTNIKENIMRLFVQKGLQRRHMKGTSTSKYTPILCCPQMNAFHLFMNHQNARLIFTVGEAAGKALSVGICCPAGYILDFSSDQACNWEQAWIISTRYQTVWWLSMFLLLPTTPPNKKNWSKCCLCSKSLIPMYLLCTT